MAILTKVTISHDKAVQADVSAKIKVQAGRADQFLEQFRNYLESFNLGVYNGTFDVAIQGDNSALASGTLTCVSVVATNTFTINGVTFTAVASGATAGQFNVGGSDTITAANIASAINASALALVTGVVTATSALGVVTISAVELGLTGNAITIASGQGTITASGARLTGGTYSTLQFREGV